MINDDGFIVRLNPTDKSQREAIANQLLVPEKETYGGKTVRWSFSIMVIVKGGIKVQIVIKHRKSRTTFWLVDIFGLMGSSSRLIW